MVAISVVPYREKILHAGLVRPGKFDLPPFRIPDDRFPPAPGHPPWKIRPEFRPENHRGAGLPVDPVERDQFVDCCVDCKG
jgi:hypothetical protein